MSPRNRIFRKPALAAQLDRTVEIPGRLLVAGPVAGPIDHVQRLARVGQGNHQRMITPLALVVDLHALLALAGGLDHRAVGVDNGFLEERRGLLPPDLQPRGIEHLLQAVDVRRVEAAAEVAGRGGIGNAAGAEGIQVGRVMAAEFQVLQARASGQKIVGDVEHVVAVVVGQVDLQHAETAVDRLGRARACGPASASPRCRRRRWPACGRRFRNGCWRPSSSAGRIRGCRSCPSGGRSAACVVRSVVVSWDSLENLRAFG